MMETALNTYSSLVENLLPFLRNRSKGSYIGLAILALVLKRAYSFLTPPKHLRQFPKLPFFTVARSFASCEAVNTRFKRLILPLIKDHQSYYTSRIPTNWTINIIDPVVAKQFLLLTDKFPKSHAVFEKLHKDSPAIQFFGQDNVGITNGETWKRQRKIMNPAFHRSTPIKIFGSVIQEMLTVIEKDSNNVPVSILMKSMTLDILGLAVFDFKFQSLQGDPEGWTETYNQVTKGLFNPWINILGRADYFYRLLSPSRRRIDDATKKLCSMLDRLADNKRMEILAGVKNDVPENEKDLLTLMLEAEIRDNEEETMSTQELRHNIALFILAGHDTTAYALAFCLYNLAKNKHVQKKAREEVLKVLGDEPADVVPTIEELRQITYLDLIIKENLRKSGPVDRLVNRVAAEDIQLPNAFIPKGTTVSVDIAALHFSPNNWDNPDQFIPERFEKGGEYENNVGTTWLPFSGGTRQCLGINFSLTEQRLALAMILKKYEIEVPKDSIHYDQIVYDKPLSFAPASLKLNFVKRY